MKAQKPAPTTPPSRVVGYTRVSTQEQASAGYGLGVQEACIGEFAKRERFELAAVFSDPGASGTVPLAERPGLSAALELVKSEDIDGLVVARFDRLARETLQALLIEQEFAKSGATVMYADAPNGREEFRFMREVMHAMAAEQRRQLVARLAASRRAKAERGGYAGGRPAFGYESEGGELRVYEPEAQVVRWVFERVARDRWPVRKVASKLDQQKALQRRWDRAAVSRILSRVDYKLAPNRIVDPRVFNRAREVLDARRPCFGEQSTA